MEEQRLYKADTLTEAKESLRRFKQVFDKAFQVAKVAEDYFGKDLVDFQWKDNFKSEERKDYINLLIKFPHVRITNEEDEWIDIQDLFVKIMVLSTGTMFSSPTFIRTTYPLLQWVNNYMHSHISFYRSDYKNWHNMCLGRSQLTSTISSLNGDFDLDIWGLYFYELEKSVQVESIKGVPYHRLSSVTSKAEVPVPNYYRINEANSYNMDIGTFQGLPEFLMYLLHTVDIEFAWNGECYVLGEPMLNFWIKVSNAFIEWINKMRFYRFPRSMMCKYIISESKVYRPTDYASLQELPEENNDYMDFYFKGVPQKLTVFKENNDDSNIKEILLLSDNYFVTLLSSILSNINRHYGREEIKY